MTFRASESQPFCHYCSKVGKTQRCSNCKRVHYCSRICQKNDWKAGHKRYCKFGAVDAIRELHRIIGDMPLQDSIEHFHRTNDLLKAYEATDRDKSTVDRESKGQKHVISNATGDVEIDIPTRSPYRNSEYISVSKSEWNYCIEKLSYISTYVVRLTSETQRMNRDIQIEDIQIDTLMFKNDGTTLRVNCKNFCLAEFLIHDRIISTTDEIMESLQYSNDQKHVSFCVRYEDSSNDSIDRSFIETHFKPLPINALNNLKCRSCESMLIREANNEGNEAILNNVYPLPSGYWDEITDYLTCFEGQAAIDFSSIKTTVRKGLAFEDEVILVLNLEDLTNVCVLAVDCFGEKEESIIEQEIQEAKDSNPIKELIQNDVTYRGEKEWKDAVGGASICCSICCANLGTISPCDDNTVRLLKHRLSSLGSTDGIDHLSRNSCATFVAKELIRYIENQAIFTFAIHGYSNEGPSRLHSCIFIKVLSWNTSLAVKDEEDHLTFHNTVKVLFEIVDFNKSSSHKKKNADKSSVDPMLFRWGGLDLCCPPDETNVNKKKSFLSSNTERSSVNMYLYGEDWFDLKKCLEKGSLFFPRQLSTATTNLKLGDEAGEASQALLSFLQL